MKSNSQRTILVSGCTRGCGRSMVEWFVKAGHIIIGCGRSTAAVAALSEQFGTPHRFDVVDVADSEQVARWAQEVLTSGLVPDLLINNAAIMNRTAPLWEISADEFQQLVNVNIVGTANVIREFVPAMIDRGSGIIINFSSGWGRSTSPEVAPYCATKYAIEGLSKSLAQELPAGMAAVPLNPGIINTDMLQSCWSDGASAYPSPEEWVNSAGPFILKINPRDNGQPLSVPL